MAEKVDLSLDDIIKMNRKSNPAQRSKTGNKPKPNLQRLKNLGTTRSTILRKGGPKQQATRQQISPKKDGPAMLHVSNLHWNVTDSDIRELFGNIGKLVRASVHYDKSARSLGTAEVVFKSRESAIKALKTYNQQSLDSRILNITLVPNPKRDIASRIGIKPGSGIQKRQPSKINNLRSGGGPKQAQGRGAPKKGPRKTERPPKKDVTVAELDADLDAYTKMNTD